MDIFITQYRDKPIFFLRAAEKWTYLFDGYCHITTDGRVTLSTTKISREDCQLLCTGDCKFVSYATEDNACYGYSTCTREGDNTWKYTTYSKYPKDGEGEHKI